MQISDRVEALPKIAIDTMADQADSRVGTFRLENADTNIPPPEHAVKATKEAVGIDKYNSWLPFAGIMELREAVAERVWIDDGLSYDPETEVLITAGTQEAMLCVLLALINPGDGVILTDPTYSGMINRVRLAGGVPQFVSLREERGWRLDLDELERKVTHETKMIFINATNMPTGCIFTKEEIEAIAHIAKKKDLWILYNAVASKLIFDGLKNHHIATMPDMKDRTIIVDGVSKNYNMVGWRIGWVIAPDKEILQHIAKAHMYNACITSGHCQVGAASALRGSQEYIDHCVSILQSRRDVLVEGLNQVEGISYVKPSGGWWFLADVREVEQDADKFAQYLLDEADVAVTPMTEWGEVCGKGHIRFIFSNEPEDRLRQAAGNVAAALASTRP